MTSPSCSSARKQGSRSTAYPDRVLKRAHQRHWPCAGPVASDGEGPLSKRQTPGILKLGMFVSATFSSLKKQTFTVVPADAVLHLHDREWVYVPAGEQSVQAHRSSHRKTCSRAIGSRFLSRPIEPGTQVVTNALLLETAGHNNAAVPLSISHSEIVGWCWVEPSS